VWELSERILGVRKKNKRIVMHRNEMKGLRNYERRIKGMGCLEVK
jgi:hypothetical protein